MARNNATEVYRCPWCGTDPVYVAYHDHEWGVPVHDERAAFMLRSFAKMYQVDPAAPNYEPAPADSDAARCVAEIALAWAAWMSMWPDATSTLPASASAATVLLTGITRLGARTVSNSSKLLHNCLLRN